MKKTTKDEKIYILLLTIIPIIMILAITKFKYMYGSNIDWLQQHVVIPNYFRNLFYETGKLFPNFTLNLGSGENIYYYSYYGLFSPIIMFSYLLPFINMTDYIIISSIFSYIISGILFYFFLKKDFSKKTSFITSFLFIFSSSLLFHTHRHIMFVNYMPFLIMALIGVNKYFKENKSFLLVLSIFLMILTSYYYSVCGLITLCLYAICFLKENKILKSIVNFLIRIFLAIGLSSFFLLPVIYVVLNGRGSGGINLNVASLIPHITLTNIFYSPYSIGVTAIVFIGLIYNILYSRKEHKIVCFFLLIFISLPLVNYLLNGGLYLNGKVFIPLLPLVLYFTANMLENNIYFKTKKLKLFLITIVISLVLIGYNQTYSIYFYIDIIVSMILLIFYSKHNNIYYLLPIILFTLILTYQVQLSDNYVLKDNYIKLNEIYNYDIYNYIDNKISLYRYQDNISKKNGINYALSKRDYRITSYSSTTNHNYFNSFYKDFGNNNMYRNKFMLNETNNIFFNKFMGIRYLLSNQEPYGYKKIKEYKNANLYENNNVYSIGYASSNLLSYDDYNKLSFIEKLEANMNNVITTTSKNSNLEFNYNNVSFSVKEYNDLVYKVENKHYYITSKNKGYIELDINNDTNSTIVIRFKMNKSNNCKVGDSKITINGVTNKLTCSNWKYNNDNNVFNYVISSNDIIKDLKVQFSKGKYDISDIEIYKIDNKFFDKKNIDELEVSNNSNIADKISGKVNVKENGYFIFTIPYDKGFTILVDGKKTNYEMVNNCFIGFKIKKGEHNIELNYKSPYSNEGKIITIVAIIMCVILYKKE